MKIKFLQTFLITALIICPLISSNILQAQTTGTLTVSFGTTFTGGSYGTKYLLAVWIQTNSGTFIKTKLKYSKTSNLDHLQTWANASAQNVTDATAGTTRPAPETLSFVWNGTDVPAAVVTDGVYKVWFEMAWGSNLVTGKTVQSFSFTKGTSADHQTGATTNLTNITIDWVPTATGITANQDKESFSVSPNPLTSESTINYSLNSLSDVTISLFDINGKLVKNLFDDNQSAGNYNIHLSLQGKVKPGIYFIKLYTGRTQRTERVIISE
jgi:hypothetical protein